MLLKVVLSAILVIGLCAVSIPMTAQAGQIVLKPVDDVFTQTYGGGVGDNPFLKFDISPIPLGRIIDSVYLRCYVRTIYPYWDGDVNFFNVNSQTWRESDSQTVLHRIPTSDSTFQASGFGMAIGWTSSIDVKDIFLRDYNASRTYCSFKLKDPDDMTRVPMPGSFPDNSETLAVGNIINQHNIVFYSSEYTADTTRITRLSVNYQGADISSSPQLEKENLLFEISPNPWRRQTTIRYQVLSPKSQIFLKVYNSEGQLIKTLVSGCNRPGINAIRWNGDDNSGQRVSSGIYFCWFNIANEVHIGKMIKVD